MIYLTNIINRGKYWHNYCLNFTNSDSIADLFSHLATILAVKKISELVF